MTTTLVLLNTSVVRMIVVQVVMARTFGSVVCSVAEAEDVPVALDY